MGCVGLEPENPEGFRNKISTAVSNAMANLFYLYRPYGGLSREAQYRGTSLIRNRPP